MRVPARTWALIASTNGFSETETAPTQSASVDTSIGTPSRAKRSLWRCRGRCSPYLAKTPSAKRFGPARPRAIGWNGAGASVMASHERQDTFSRTCWINNQLAGTRSCFTADGFEDACRRLNVQHRTTRPYTPQTNGLVERFNGRVQREVLGITISR